MKNYLYHIARPGMTVREGYIGVTIDPEARFKSHKKSEYRVGNAIRKYDDVTMTILMESSAARCYATEKMLRPEENIGWNILIGGGVPPSYKGWAHSAEAKAKISKAHKGKVTSDETKAKMSKARMGKAISDEAKAKISEANSRPSNVYSAETGALVAEGVSLLRYANEHGLNHSNLVSTAVGIARTIKGLYARNQCACGQPIEYIWKGKAGRPGRAKYDAEMALAYEVK